MDGTSLADLGRSVGAKVTTGPRWRSTAHRLQPGSLTVVDESPKPAAIVWRDRSARPRLDLLDGLRSDLVVRIDDRTDEALALDPLLAAVEPFVRRPVAIAPDDETEDDETEDGEG